MVAPSATARLSAPPPGPGFWRAYYAGIVADLMSVGAFGPANLMEALAMSVPDFARYRLWLSADMAAGTQVSLEREQANYLLNVLRLKSGDSVLVFNGRDGEWRRT